MYNADNMQLFLGSESTDDQARNFAEYLMKREWELVKNSDGQMVAYHEDGHEMTEQEWQEALRDAFK